jgi:hypothetical protein
MLILFYVVVVVHVIVCLILIGVVLLQQGDRQTWPAHLAARGLKPPLGLARQLMC